jgi:hypothetical protein
MSANALTEVNEWLELLDTNSTSSSFAATAPTATEPTGDNVITLSRLGTMVCQNLMLAFFGAGNDDQTFDARVYGWQQVAGLWVPTLLAQLSCTLSTVVGVAGYPVLNTERFADTYSLASGFNANVSVEVVSPANNTIGHVLLDVRGFSKIQVDFDMTGATSANALYKGL